MGSEVYLFLRSWLSSTLSVLLKRAGLPSTGRLLVWIRLLHAAEWLGDLGRTGQSVSRSFEYSSGAAFRRVLKNYTGATPTLVATNRGMPFVLGHFLRETGFDPAVGALVSVA